MSRFESSRFLRNSSVMHADVLKSACDSLGWTYEVKGDILTVSDAQQNSNMYGEYVLQLNMATNMVSYNTYYTPDAPLKVKELQDKFNQLNAEYAMESLIESFKAEGFTYLSDLNFVPNEKEKYSFFMEGISTDPEEIEPIAQIKFTILYDGTVITNSDYLPNDVNERAHDAMDVLEELLGNKRVMTRKEIPSHYVDRLKPRRAKAERVSYINN